MSKFDSILQFIKHYGLQSILIRGLVANDEHEAFRAITQARTGTCYDFMKDLSKKRSGIKVFEVNSIGGEIAEPQPVGGMMPPSQQVGTPTSGMEGAITQAIAGNKMQELQIVMLNTLVNSYFGMVNSLVSKLTAQPQVSQTSGAQEYQKGFMEALKMSQVMRAVQRENEDEEAEDEPTPPEPVDPIKNALLMKLLESGAIDKILSKLGGDDTTTPKDKPNPAGSNIGNMQGGLLGTEQNPH